MSDISEVNRVHTEEQPTAAVTFYARVEGSEVVNRIGTIEVPAIYNELPEPNESGATHTLTVNMPVALRGMADWFETPEPAPQTPGTE